MLIQPQPNVTLLAPDTNGGNLEIEIGMRTEGERDLSKDKGIFGVRWGLRRRLIIQLGLLHVGVNSAGELLDNGLLSSLDSSFLLSLSGLGLVGVKNMLRDFQNGLSVFIGVSRRTCTNFTLCNRCEKISRKQGNRRKRKKKKKKISGKL